MSRKIKLVLLVVIIFILPVSAWSQETCVDELMQKLKIDPNMQSDPLVVWETMEMMGLADFEKSEEIYADLLNEPQDLTLFIGEVRNAILEKNEPIEEFLCRALDAGLIPESQEIDEHVETAIHTAVILNRLTGKMYDSVSFMREIKEHYIQKRETALGAKRGTLGYWWKINKEVGGLFEILKTATMDAVFEQYIGFREKGDLTRFDLVKKNAGLKINLAEAMLKDLEIGANDNSKVGRKLMASPMLDLYNEGENSVLKQVFEKGWAPIYNSWNFAFMTGNLHDLHLLYPKLFMPRVSNASEEDYLFNRGLSLWITVNVLLLRRVNGEEEVVLPNAEELSRIWGDVNLDYANSLGF